MIVCLCVTKLFFSLRAERHRREARREKFKHEKMYLFDDPPRPSRPGPSDDNHDNDDDEDNDKDNDDDNAVGGNEEE